MGGDRAGDRSRERADELRRLEAAERLPARDGGAHGRERELGERAARLNAEGVEADAHAAVLELLHPEVVVRLIGAVERGQHRGISAHQLRQRLAKLLQRGESAQCFDAEALQLMAEAREEPAMAEFDLVIRGGTLADGTGAELREADIAIVNGTIAAVGAVAGKGREEIDARGHLVTPGFVDIHTHYDGQATWDSQLAPSCWHGVTTAVMGNCGVGLAPVRTEDRGRLVELMEGVEDIPGAALHEGLKWNWESFGDYLDALEQRPRDIDIGAQLPHGALRVYVMGERGAALEAATDDDMAQMRRLTSEAMRAGAIGFTTSRTLNHRTATGDPTPSLRATEAELTAIALGLKDAGSGVFELISDFNQPDPQTEFAMLRRLVEVSGRPLSLSLAQAGPTADGWRGLLSMIEGASRDGLPIRAQVAQLDPEQPIADVATMEQALSQFIAEPRFNMLLLACFAGLAMVLAAVGSQEYELKPATAAERLAVAYGQEAAAEITAHLG